MNVTSKDVNFDMDADDTVLPSDVTEFLTDYDSVMEMFKNELHKSFDDLIDVRFPYNAISPEWRRAQFMSYIQSFEFSYLNLHAVVMMHGANFLLTATYFLMYQFVSMLNRNRGNFMDEVAVREMVRTILNDCAANNFETLYNTIFCE